MINFFKYFAFFAFVAGCFVAPDASAQALGGTNDVFTTVLTRLVATFKNVRSVIFVIGGFGLVGLAFLAIFGKVRWGWLAALAAGLAILAVAGAAVDYVTQSATNQTLGQTQQLGDTLY
ncbi:MAG: TrbC/VirB2 family protein [Alphaproteobacteria bacterium]|nr:TrbC/VirB2 family protein [Alphaproteobacteria bacterium]